MATRPRTSCHLCLPWKRGTGPMSPRWRPCSPQAHRRVPPRGRRELGGDARGHGSLTAPLVGNPRFARDFGDRFSPRLGGHLAQPRDVTGLDRRDFRYPDHGRCRQACPIATFHRDILGPSAAVFPTPCPAISAFPLPESVARQRLRKPRADRRDPGLRSREHGRVSGLIFHRVEAGEVLQPGQPGNGG